jgi:hypothetical protein
VNISGTLTQQRVAVLHFDFTGLGESEGDFADTTPKNIGATRRNGRTSI